MVLGTVVAAILIIWLLSANRHGAANKVIYNVPSGRQATREQKDKEVEKFLNDVQ